MVTVLMLLPICVMLAAIMFSNVLSEKRFLRFERDRGQSFYLAETGINSAYYSFSESTITGFTHLRDNDESDPNEPGVPLSKPRAAGSGDGQRLRGCVRKVPRCDD